MTYALITLTSTALFLVLYHHIIYPLLLMVARHIRGNKLIVHPTPLAYQYLNSGDDLPFITIVMPAYNEAEFIAEKIRNLACLDYPPTHFIIILAADGCTDDTVDIALKTSQEAICKNLPLIINDYPNNRGKIAVINDVLAGVDSEIVAFTDVSALISIDALYLSALRFKDSTVGAINGNYRFLNPASTGEAVYWLYQGAIKIGEEMLGSVLGAHGAFYIMRTKLFQPLAENIVNDDFIISMRVIEQGYRVVYESRLNAVEQEQSSTDIEWNRRLRISIGNIQQVIMLRQLFHPKYRGVALAFLSGKGLRVAMPIFLLISFLGSFLLFFIPFFAFLAVMQLLVYFIVIVFHFTQTRATPDAENECKKEGYTRCGSSLSAKLLNTLYYLVRGYTANLIGFFRYFSGTAKTRW